MTNFSQAETERNILVENLPFEFFGREQKEMFLHLFVGNATSERMKNQDTIEQTVFPLKKGFRNMGTMRIITKKTSDGKDYDILSTELLFADNCSKGRFWVFFIPDRGSIQYLHLNGTERAYLHDSSSQVVWKPVTDTNVHFERFLEKTIVELNPSKRVGRRKKLKEILAKTQALMRARINTSWNLDVCLPSKDSNWLLDNPSRSVARRNTLAA